MSHLEEILGAPATIEEITERNADKILRPYPSDKVCDWKLCL